MDPILSTKLVCEQLGVSRSTLHELRKRADFPSPVRFLPRKIGWRSSEILAYVDRFSSSRSQPKNEPGDAGVEVCSHNK